MIILQAEAHRDSVRGSAITLKKTEEPRLSMRKLLVFSSSFKRHISPLARIFPPHLVKLSAVPQLKLHMHSLHTSTLKSFQGTLYMARFHSFSKTKKQSFEITGEKQVKDTLEILAKKLTIRKAITTKMSVINLIKRQRGFAFGVSSRRRNVVFQQCHTHTAQSKRWEKLWNPRRRKLQLLVL